MLVRTRTDGLVVQTVGAAALLGFGLGLVVARWEESPPLVALGAFCGVAGLTVLGALPFRHGLLGSPARPRLSTLPDGARATFLPRSRVSAVGAALLSGELGLLLLVWTALAARRPDGWLPAVLSAVAAIVFLSLPLFALTGRWRAGGVWLTPTRIVHRAFGVTSSARWADVEGVELAVLPPRVHVRAAEQRYTTPYFRGGRLASAGELPLNLDGLGVPRVHAALIVDLYWRHPDLRPELATEAGPQRVATGARRPSLEARRRPPGS